VKSTKESYIRVNTRELDRVPSTKCLSYIHLADDTYYTKPSLSSKTYILYAVDM